MKNLIIGAGEVGTALFAIFSTKHETYLRDVEDLICDDVDVLHIAFPDHSGFVGQVKNYIAQYKPELTIIHSSVEVGTTDQCGPRVVYSPVRGRHPSLAAEMLAYPKYIGGIDERDVDVAARFFHKCGWDTSTGWRPDETELVKLLSNVHMGLEIAWRQEVARLMPGSQEIYQRWELDYSEGYQKLGQTHLIRPRLRADPIGGHCILECVKLLGEVSPLVSEFIEKSNELAKEKSYGPSRSNNGHQKLSER